MKKIIIKYDELGHISEEQWELLEDCYCSNCGKKGHVWQDQSGGDYYEGCQAICINCNSTSYEPEMYSINDDKDLQRVSQLKGGK